MPRFSLVILSVAALVLEVLPLRACWNRLDPRSVVGNAKLIVVGKVIRIERAGFTRRHENVDRPYDVAIVEVTEVLKGQDRRRPIRVAQPARDGVRLSTDIRYKVGQEGIWLLDYEPALDVHAAAHPDKFRPLHEKDQVAKLIHDSLVQEVRLVRDPINPAKVVTIVWPENDEPGADDKDTKKIRKLSEEP